MGHHAAHGLDITQANVRQSGLLGLANHEITHWNVLGEVFRVSQFKSLISIRGCTSSGTATSLT